MTEEVLSQAVAVSVDILFLPSSSFFVNWLGCRKGKQVLMAKQQVSYGLGVHQSALLEVANGHVSCESNFSTKASWEL